MTEEFWEGVAPNDNHRTTGGRAWCLDDMEWCYADILCPCCLIRSPAHVVCPNCDGVGYISIPIPDPQPATEGT